MIQWIKRLLGVSPATAPLVAENIDLLDRLRHACARQVVEHDWTAPVPSIGLSGPSSDKIDDERISHNTRPEFID